MGSKKEKRLSTLVVDEKRKYKTKLNGINRVSIVACILTVTSTGPSSNAKKPVLWWEAKLSLSRAQLIIKAAAGQSNFHARLYPSFVRRNASQCLAKVSRKIEFFSSIFLLPFLSLLFFSLSFFFFLALIRSTLAPSSLQTTSKSSYFYRSNVRLSNRFQPRYPRFDSRRNVNKSSADLFVAGKEKKEGRRRRRREGEGGGGKILGIGEDEKDDCC